MMFQSALDDCPLRREDPLLEFPSESAWPRTSGHPVYSLKVINHLQPYWTLTDRKTTDPRPSPDHPPCDSDAADRDNTASIALGLLALVTGQDVEPADPPHHGSSARLSISGSTGSPAYATVTTPPGPLSDLSTATQEPDSLPSLVM
jgi:hypothetical protein